MDVHLLIFGPLLGDGPKEVTNNGKHVQIIKILNFMQILCHRKDRKVGKEIKMLGRGVGRILSWVGEYTPLKQSTFFSNCNTYKALIKKDCNIVEEL